MSTTELFLIGRCARHHDALPADYHRTASESAGDKRAGEWTVVLSPTSDFATTPGWLGRGLGCLFAAFKGVRLRRLELDDWIQRAIWERDAAAVALHEWIADHDAWPFETAELQADLDLCADLMGDDGRVLHCWLPAAATCFIDGRRLIESLAIWTNVFTNQIYVFRDDPELIPFQPAASVNRARLAAGLRAWERVVGEPVSDWWSEYIDGVERYGFAAEAAPDRWV